jgi:RimJ/RimL family protein N-acetyltransferase
MASPMARFTFQSLADCPESESVALSDAYFEARIIDSPADRFAKLAKPAQEEILSRYRGGGFLKVMDRGTTIGYVGHGLKPTADTIMIFYLLLPMFRGRGLFKPMISAFAEWCRDKYPERKFLRANTQKTNIASVNSLLKAGFELKEELLDGPEGQEKVLLQSFVRKIG